MVSPVEVIQFTSCWNTKKENHKCEAPLKLCIQKENIWTVSFLLAVLHLCTQMIVHAARTSVRRTFEQRQTDPETRRCTVQTIQTFLIFSSETLKCTVHTIHTFLIFSSETRRCTVHTIHTFLIFSSETLIYTVHTIHTFLIFSSVWHDITRCKGTCAKLVSVYATHNQYYPPQIR